MRVALEKRGYLIWALMSAEEFSKWKAQGWRDLDTQLFLMAPIEYLLYARALVSSRTRQGTQEAGSGLFVLPVLPLTQARFLTHVHAPTLFCTSHYTHSVQPTNPEDLPACPSDH